MPRTTGSNMEPLGKMRVFGNKDIPAPAAPVLAAPVAVAPTLAAPPPAPDMYGPSLPPPEPSSAADTSVDMELEGSSKKDDDRRRGRDDRSRRDEGRKRRTRSRSPRGRDRDRRDRDRDRDRRDRDRRGGRDRSRERGRDRVKPLSDAQKDALTAMKLAGLVKGDAVPTIPLSEQLKAKGVCMDNVLQNYHAPTQPNKPNALVNAARRAVPFAQIGANPPSAAVHDIGAIGGPAAAGALVPIGGPKKKKSRWANEIDRAFIPGLSTTIPAGLTSDQERAYLVQLQIEETSRRLRTGDYGIPINPEDRSPSPEPVYDHRGQRVNMRESRKKAELEAERHNLVKEMQGINPMYRPPPDYKPPNIRLNDKVFIPQDDYPHLNFVGRLIGPRGNTLKALEKETGAKIIIRGKGSVKDGKILKGDMPLPGADEPLHAYITASDADCLGKAVTKIHEILQQCIDVPEDYDELRKVQLRELALLNGTLRPEDIVGSRCSNCGSNEHKSWECMERANVTQTIVCSICGGAGHIARDCKNRVPGMHYHHQMQQPQLDDEYSALMTELGQGGERVRQLQPANVARPMGMLTAGPSDDGGGRKPLLNELVPPPAGARMPHGAGEEGGGSNFSSEDRVMFAAFKQEQMMKATPKILSVNLAEQSRQHQPQGSNYQQPSYGGYNQQGGNWGYDQQGYDYGGGGGYPSNGGGYGGMYGQNGAGGGSALFAPPPPPPAGGQQQDAGGWGAQGWNPSGGAAGWNYNSAPNPVPAPGQTAGAGSSSIFDAVPPPPPPPS